MGMEYAASATEEDAGEKNKVALTKQTVEALEYLII